MTFRLLSLGLVLLSIAVSVASFPDGCKQYYVPVSSGAVSSPVLSSILVGDAFHLGAVYVSDLSLSSTSSMEALKITLSAVTSSSIDPVTVTLKSTGEGGVSTALSAVTFDDLASGTFPDNLDSPPPVISGSFFPSEDLTTFVNSSNTSTNAGEGGSYGSWVLRVVDLSPQDPPAGSLTLSSWSLILCPDTVILPPPVEFLPMADEVGASVSAQSGSNDNSSSLSLLEDILNRIDRNTSGPLSSLNNTLARDFADYQAGGSTNASVFQRIENRLNKLLAGYSSANGTNSSASLLGSFQLGNLTLPTGPTARLLDALRTVISDMDGSPGRSSSILRSITSSSPPSVSAADGPSSLLGGSMLKSLASSLTGVSSSNYLQQVTSFLQSLESKAASPLVSNSPLVSKLQSTGSNAKLAIGALESLASQSIQSKLNLLNSQTSLIKSQLQGKISNYENVIQLSSGLISQAITQHSNSILGAGKQIQARAQGLKSQLSNTKVSKLMQAHLSSITQSAHAVGNIGKTISGEVASLVQQLMGVYKAQLQGVSDIASAKSSATLTLAQAKADTTLSALSAVIDKWNAALDGWSSNVGPLAGKEIKLYQSGLSFLNTGLQAVKARVVSTPTTVNYSTLLSNLGASKVSALSGPTSSGTLLSQATAKAADVKAQVQQFYSSLGSGATGATNLNLIGKIDAFDAKIKSLFPKLAAATSG